MKKVLLFINPRSRRGREQLHLVKNWLLKHQFVILNSDPGCDSDTLLQEFKAHKHTADVAIIGGGDGSINSALPGLLDTQIPLLYLPIGTLNILARNLGLSMDAEENLKLLFQNHGTSVPIATANGHPFHSVLGLGLSTQVNRLVRSDLKRWFGAFAFIWTGLKVIYRISPFRYELQYDGHVHKGRSWQMTICNGLYYGSGFEISEQAKIELPRLWGQSIETKKWWQAFKFIPLVFSRQLSPHKGLKEFSGAEIVLKTKRKMRVDLDGDVKTRTPLSIHVLDQRLKILSPPPKSF